MDDATHCMIKVKYIAQVEIQFEYDNNLRSIDELVDFYATQYDSILRSKIYYALKEEAKKVEVKEPCVEAFELGGIINA